MNMFKPIDRIIKKVRDGEKYTHKCEDSLTKKSILSFKNKYRFYLIDKKGQAEKQGLSCTLTLPDNERVIDILIDYKVSCKNSDSDNRDNRGALLNSVCNDDRHPQVILDENIREWTRNSFSLNAELKNLNICNKKDKVWKDVASKALDEMGLVLEIDKVSLNDSHIPGSIDIKEDEVKIRPHGYNLQVTFDLIIEARLENELLAYLSYEQTKDEEILSFTKNILAEGTTLNDLNYHYNAWRERKETRLKIKLKETGYALKDFVVRPHIFKDNALEKISFNISGKCEYKGVFQQHPNLPIKFTMNYSIALNDLDKYLSKGLPNIHSIAEKTLLMKCSEDVFNKEYKDFCAQYVELKNALCKGFEEIFLNFGYKTVNNNCTSDHFLEQYFNYPIELTLKQDFQNNFLSTHLVTFKIGTTIRINSFNNNLLPYVTTLSSLEAFLSSKIIELAIPVIREGDPNQYFWQYVNGKVKPNEPTVIETLGKSIEDKFKKDYGIVVEKIEINPDDIKLKTLKEGLFIANIRENVKVRPEGEDETIEFDFSITIDGFNDVVKILEKEPEIELLVEQINEQLSTKLSKFSSETLTNRDKKFNEKEILLDINENINKDYGLSIAIKDLNRKNLTKKEKHDEKIKEEAIIVSEQTYKGSVEIIKHYHLVSIKDLQARASEYEKNILAAEKEMANLIGFPGKERLLKQKEEAIKYYKAKLNEVQLEIYQKTTVQIGVQNNYLKSTDDNEKQKLEHESIEGKEIEYREDDNENSNNNED